MIKVKDKGEELQIFQKVTGLTLLLKKMLPVAFDFPKTFLNRYFAKCISTDASVYQSAIFISVFNLE